jgi:D-sedoheptulose 7-phosphate isomerase
VSEALEAALAEHVEVSRSLAALLLEVDETAARLVDVFAGGGRLYSFGNGGSSTEAQHLAEELVGRFLRERRPLPAQSLSSDAAAITCIANDFAFEDVFARQVEAFARPGDAVIGFTTSGDSENVIRGLEQARRIGAVTVLLAGEDGGRARPHADHALLVPSRNAARIQELHVLLMHMLLDRIDSWAAGEE